MKNFLFYLFLLSMVSIPYSETVAQDRSAVKQQQLTKEQMAVIEERYNKGERNAELIQQYATVIQRKPVKTQEEFRGKAAKIENMVQDYFSSLSTADRIKPENMFIYRQYTSSSTQPAAQFLINNKTAFPSEVQVEVEQMINRIIDTDVMNYFSGEKVYNAQHFKLLKKQIRRSGLNKDRKYDTSFRFIEARGKGSVFDYMKFCEKNVGQLNKEQQILVFGHFASQIDMKDIEQRMKAAKFLRGLLPQLDMDVVYQTISQIVALESQN